VSRHPQGFDGKAERFRQRIYGHRKGVIRLALLWEQLNAQVPLLSQGPVSEGACRESLSREDDRLSVLDLGCGIGQLSARLAALGHHPTLVDASTDMLQMAQAHYQEVGLMLEPSQLICAGLDAVDSLGLPQYDLVLMHAVLEWLPDPQPGLAVAAARVRPGGYLSLAYYNRHGLIYRNLLHGNFDPIRREHYSGHEGGFTPIHAILPDELESWLAPLGLEPVYRAGLRTFSDFMPRIVAEKYSDEEVLEMERRFAEVEPYRSLGRYQHLICRKVGV